MALGRETEGQHSRGGTWVGDVGSSCFQEHEGRLGFLSAAVPLAGAHRDCPGAGKLTPLAKI